MSTFKTIGISYSFLRELDRLKMRTPSDIQIQAYPFLSKGKDAWLNAPTGSGKTLAYLIPLLERTDTSTKDIQVAVIAPTQELAVQIHEAVRTLDANGNLAIRSQLLIGNASSKRQKEQLKKKKPHIVIGSSGRMIELVQAGKLKLHNVRAVSIDEADVMLSEDHIGNLEALLKRMPRDRQLVFSSATEKADAFRIAQEMGKEVAWVTGENIESDSTIEHFYVDSDYHHRADTLRKLLRAVQPQRALIFTHRNRGAKELGNGFERFDIPHAVLHGELSKFERESALKRFRTGTVPYLISSDVSARGLDIQGLTHIINFDIPTLPDDYLHRVGRTGRMGEAGVAISIVAGDEVRLIRRYEADLDITVKRGKLQGGVFDLSPANDSPAEDSSS
ncbi:DEAD/DEAH box helicase [Puniceicoccus vermicola]|nr:DEAD/DEAH box helicase [Puniceicoccus vermicola]